jgi:peptidyl-prolyl cis-trans isomerase A (cyclophilin A)
MHTNARYTMTFATSGKDSRTTQLFINFVDNQRLDGMGFAPFAKVLYYVK